MLLFLGHPRVWPLDLGLTLRWTCLHLLTLFTRLNVSGLGDSQMSRQVSLPLPSSQMTLGLSISRISLHHPAALRLVSSIRGMLRAASCGTPLHPERPFPLHLLCAQGTGDLWRQRWEDCHF